MLNIQCISVFAKYAVVLQSEIWNLPDSAMKSARFHMKSTEYLAFRGAKWAKDQWSYFSVFFSS